MKKAIVLARILLWITLASVLCFLAGPNFLSLLNGALNTNFGSLFPAIPFVALLLVLFLLRGNDLVNVISKETSELGSERNVRFLGFAMIIALVLLGRDFSSIGGEIATIPIALYVEGFATVLLVYAASLVVNPLTKKIMLPYALIYLAGVSIPAIAEWGLGEPLASFSASLSAIFVSISGIPVAWHGTAFVLVSRTGDQISAIVTPGCSSVLSITTFLGLLGLIHLDLKKDIGSTIKLALTGTVALTVLNSLRILLLIWIGYTSGAGEFWSAHDWIGYALFLVFYLVAIPIYARMGVSSSTMAPTVIIGFKK